MKVLLIRCIDDYDASIFEETYSGRKVEELIKEVQSGRKLSYVPDDGENFEFDAEVFEFGEVDKKFIDFVKEEIQDYDVSKSTNFYLETQIIGE